MRVIRHFSRNILSEVYGFVNSLFLVPVRVSALIGKNQVKVGRRLNGRHVKIVFTGRESSLDIGDNVTFCGNGIELWIMGNNSHMSIGDRVTIHRGSHLVSGENCKLSLGENCLIGPNVNIRGSDSHKIYKDGQRINPDHSILIADRVWVAEGATVLKGTTISDDCVIGTKSIARGSYSSGQLLVGTPARPVKKGIVWQE